MCYKYICLEESSSNEDQKKMEVVKVVDKTKVIDLYDCGVSEFDGQVIVRGTIAPGSLADLLVAPYQREVLPVSKPDEWLLAFRRGEVPDVYLGMRGTGIGTPGNGRVQLLEPTYLIDGLQRRTAALLMMERGEQPHLGARVLFNTTESGERELFQRLNVRPVRLSSNVIIGNLRHDLPVVAALYALTEASGFVLSGRVTWGQRAKKSDLIGATTLLRVASELHAHLGATRTNESVRLGPGLQTVADELTHDKVLANVVYFFDLLDVLWELGKVQYRDRSVVSRQSFLVAVARLFSDHFDFWQGTKLFVRQPERTKIGSYPVDDPSVGRLQNRDAFYRDIRTHINSGRRHGQLRRRGSEF